MHFGSLKIPVILLCLSSSGSGGSGRRQRTEKRHKKRFVCVGFHTSTWGGQGVRGRGVCASHARVFEGKDAFSTDDGPSRSCP